MKRITEKDNRHTSKPGNAPADTSLIITCIVALYAILSVFTPIFSAIDSNGPKFLALSFLNLFSLGVIFFHPKISLAKKDPVNFVDNPVGIMISFLLVLSLISFSRVINVFEFLITFSKFVTTFSAALILFIIFRMDQRYFRQLFFIMAIILFIDCMSVFFGTILYIEGKISSINEIKSVYANKNILAAAIFVKLPIAIWFHLTSEKKWKAVSLLLLFFAFIAILLLSARASYLGMGLLTVVYLATLYVRFLKEKEKKHIRSAIEYASMLVTVVLLFSFIQAFIYPRNTDQYNKSIAQRITSMTKEGGSYRLFYWMSSWDLIKDHPLMGVGLGNWKIVDLKYENRTNQLPDYQYHTHNDFIEITAETGFLGGLAYLLVFVLAIFYCARAVTSELSFRKNPQLFISSLGLLCYGVDAFFNFPSDRAEMQTIFALYLGSVICFAPSAGWKISPGKVRISIMFLVHSLVLLCVIFCLYLNFVSLQYQLITKTDIKNNQYTRTSAYMLQGFPFMPDISSYGEPIVCYKSRYLANEKRYDQAIRLLQNDKSSPYDARVPEFICLYYHDWGKLDSSLKYAEKSIAMKPAFYKYTGWACDIYNAKGDLNKSIALLLEYTGKTKTNPDAWLDLALTYTRIEEQERAIAAINSGLSFQPGDSILLSNKKWIEKHFIDKRYKNAFDEGELLFKKKEYKHAVECYTRIIYQDTSLLKAYEYRGLSLVSLKEYRQALADFSFLIRHEPLTGKYYNNRGVCLVALKNLDDACSDFQKAKDLGDVSAVDNYIKFCSRK